MKQIVILFVVLVISISMLTGCASKAGTYAGIGSALGAITGAVVCDSKNREGCMAAGAAIGGLGGYGLGNAADKDKAEKDQLYQNQQELANKMERDRLAQQKSLDEQRWETDARMQEQMMQRFAQFKASYRQVIPFTTGSAVITTFASSQLDSIARELKQYPDNPQQMMVIVTGYADGTGASNESLAMRRAFAIKGYLNSRGLNNVDVNYMTVPNGDARARAAVITLR